MKLVLVAIVQCMAVFVVGGVKKNDQVLNCVLFTDMMKTNKIVVLTERMSASNKEEKQDSKINHACS